MDQKIVVGPLNKGLRNDVTPFNIDNDSFPYLYNAYQWRGRIKRKRGTSLLGRLSRYLGLTTGGAPQTINIIPFPLVYGVSQFVIGSVILTDPTPIAAVEPVTLLTTNPLFTGTLNRTTGVLSLSGFSAGTSIIYYPGLPVLGLEPFVSDATSVTQQVAFDTTYSYNVPLGQGIGFYDVSFYNNPSTGTYAGYTQKTTWTPLNWNLQDYQQMWSTNYSGAMWAVPGVPAPFVTTNIGMQFKRIANNGAVAVGAPVTDVDFTTTNNHPFVAGDFVFANEFTTITGLNFQTGYVLSAPAPTATTFRARFPSAIIAGTSGTGGIVQALTTSCDPDTSSTTPGNTKDCIRWYNGTMVNYPTTQIPSLTDKGWVNFAPPLTSNNPGNFSISDLPSTTTPYYIVGAKMAVPFKDRLIFFGPVVQTSSGSPKYLPDTIIYSQNGTPYYTCSFPYITEQPTISVLTSATYQPVLLPSNQSATVTSWWENSTGFGGFLNAGFARPIATVSINEDALIVGFIDRQTRLLYTGNDIVPFNFYIINSELGSDATFSSTTLDRGVISFGGRGIILTSQIASQRIDLEIPDEIFEITGTVTAARSICSQRDFQNEWIEITYPSGNVPWTFPNTTLQYNYRDGTWAQFGETYTTYGSIRYTTGLTWGTVGSTYPTWGSWTVPWNSGTDTIGQPLVYAGNAQGFVITKGQGTNEATSLYIQNIVGSVVTSPNHCLNNGDYIVISGVQGTVASQVNGQIFQVDLIPTSTSFDPDTFNLIDPIAGGTYTGGGLITRMYVPYIQTKQFPVAWDMARKTRIGAQQYLLSTTSNAQITLLIFLSQDGSLPYNAGPIVPFSNSINNALVYSTVLYTCPESTNLGLSPSNTNLQMVTAASQDQIWHRMNTSLLGDTIQIGFTLSDAQMKSPLNGTAQAITGATQAYPCILTCAGAFAVGSIITIGGVAGMVELNGNNYIVLSSTPTTVTIDVNSTRFTTYISGGTATLVPEGNQFAEIELHSMILSVSPSQVLA